MKPQMRSWPSFPGGRGAFSYGSGKTSSMAEGAKNHRVQTGCQWTLDLGTYNIRTMKADSRLQELLIELEYIKWDIIGLCEIRRKGEDLIKLDSGHLLYTNGTDDGKFGGVGFLINRKLKDSVVKVESTSDRVAQCILQLNKRYKLQIIQAYAPTISHNDDEVEGFYEDIAGLQDREKCYFKILMGDFNARIGKTREGERSTGPFGSGVRDDRGDGLVNFAECQGLYILNSFFIKKSQQKMDMEKPRRVRKRD